MAEELLEKIPPEKRWAITAKILTGFFVRRGTMILPPLLGKGEGIISPIMGFEKLEEVNNKIWEEGGRRFISRVKEAFNIPVKDAVGAVKLYIVACFLLAGPEGEFELLEATSERAVVRWTQCGWWERYKEFEIDPGLSICKAAHPIWGDVGLKAINPKFTFKHTKQLPRGDSYCEAIIEFKDE
jgi:hypothetical protein